MVGHGISIASRVPPDGPPVARSGLGGRSYAVSTPAPSPSSPSAAPVAHATTSAREIVVPWATTWSASPSSSDRIRHAAAAGSGADERPAGHALADRPLEQPLPLEVEPAGGRLERRPSRGLGPGVEPQLERPVLVGRRVGPEEDPHRLDRVARLPHQPRGQLEVLLGDLLERRRQHLVHRIEVVVDQAAGGAHRRRHVADRRGGEALGDRHVQGGRDDRLAALGGGMRRMTAA